jgi:hypothetical protein
MTMKSFVNKYSKLLASLAALFAIADYILKWLELIPSFIAIIILIIAAILVLPLLMNIKSGSKLRRYSLFSFAIFFFLGLAYHFISDKPKSDINSKIAMNENLKIIDAPMTLKTDNSIKEVNDKKNSIEINAPVTANGNSKVTIANEITTYNKPPQRHLTESDFKRLEEATLGIDKIQVLFPQNDKEASVFGNQIFDKLFEISPNNLSKGYINGSIKFSSERFSIQPMKYQQNAITIVVNPQ